ncbi:glycosyltransferase family 2 protein [Niabella aurantiaca]|uniref:glycosyltransferase family 2 protein n=1 Tax=Niabella aurantiaca TaxID=379900 RepID=UPI0003801271|nr:glycosyltransferase family 2 protein [Niabella aurantiaca]
MKVTIQIPTYNQVKYIRKAVVSCLEMNYEDLEINIVDDSSTEDTEHEIKDLLNDTRVNFYRNKVNLGRVKNYYKSLREYATGEWVVNLDGDDYFTDCEFISRAVKNVLQCPSVVMYHSNFFDLGKIHNRDVEKRISKGLNLIKGSSYIKYRHRFNHFYHLSALFKRVVALQCDFYSFDSLNTDSLSLLKLATLGDVLLENREVGVWNINPNSESRQYETEINKEKYRIAELELLSYLEGFLTKQEMEFYKKEQSRTKFNIEIYKAAEEKNFSEFFRMIYNEKRFDLNTIKQFTKLFFAKKSVN